MKTIEELATLPILEMVNEYGGWPMIDPTWNPNTYEIMDVVGKLSHLGVGVFINSQVSPSFEDSTANVMVVSCIYSLEQELKKSLTVPLGTHPEFRDDELKIMRGKTWAATFGTYDVISPSKIKSQIYATSPLLFFLKICH